MEQKNGNILLAVTEMFLYFCIQLKTKELCKNTPTI